MKIAVKLIRHTEKTCDFGDVVKRRVGHKIEIKQTSECQNKMLQAKGNMETITIFVSKKLKEGESDVAGVANSHRVINDMMNDWM